jgi:hypothetical protein
VRLPPDLEVQLRRLGGVVHVGVDGDAVGLLANRARALPDLVEQCREVLERGLGRPTSVQVSWTGIDRSAAPLPPEVIDGTGIAVDWRLGCRGEVRAIEVAVPPEADLTSVEQRLEQLGSGLAAKVRLRRRSSGTPPNSPTIGPGGAA